MLPGQQLPGFMKAVMLPGVRKVIAALPPTRKSQESTLRQIGHGKSIDAGRLSETHGEWYMALMKHTNTMRNEFDMIYHARGKQGGFDPTYTLDAETLARVTVPTHFIWGADDTFGGESVARWVVDAMSNATLEMVPDSGHLPWIDDPVYVGAETARFLRSQT
jgi:pimeloyl-ACP methyl ester carboxylesterase